jgi:hypothetical protein
MQTLWQDLLYGARRLRKHPGLAIISEVALAPRAKPLQHKVASSR